MRQSMEQDQDIQTLRNQVNTHSQVLRDFTFTKAGSHGNIVNLDILWAWALPWKFMNGEKERGDIMLYFISQFEDSLSIGKYLEFKCW